jgi:hypothetical protein
MAFVSVGGGVDSQACNPVATNLSGKAALIRRDGCSDVSVKVLNAQNAGISYPIHPPLGCCLSLEC